jgi:hypothetical protein
MGEDGEHAPHSLRFRKVDGGDAAKRDGAGYEKGIGGIAHHKI